MKVIPTFIAVSLLTSVNVFGQDPPKVIPPSPTASSLMKYADVPVGLYTGVASVNVPLYELKGPNLNLPLNFSYHAGGIRVEENASWVGLGWSLNAGGAISRTTKGLRDEASGGYLSNGALPENPQIIGYFEQAVLGQMDTEPDIFFFNMNGRSGKFYLQKLQSPGATVVVGYSIPYQDIRIKCTYTPDLLTDFTITTEDGTEYFFSQLEVTQSRNYLYRTTSSIEGPVMIGDRTSESVTSWFLTEIRSAAGNDVITFNYVPEASKYETAKSGSATYDPQGRLVKSTMNYNEITVQAKRLASIRYDKIGATVEFVAGEERTDVIQVSADKARALSQVLIRRDGVADPIKRFDLVTSYFTNPVATQSYGGQQLPAEQQYLFKRLRLDKVVEKSGDGVTVLPAYSFKYNSIPLPPKNGETQDHWGYFNGPAEPSSPLSYYSNYFMMPGFYGEIDNSLDQYFYNCNGVTETYSLARPSLLDLAGANREPNPFSIQAGILTEIKYPGGGTTKLDYSPHQYGFVSADPITKTIYEQILPQAFIERPWENNPTENETKNYEFVAPETGQYKLEFDVEFGYKDQADYESGIAYNRNEVKITAAGVAYPLVKVYWDYNGSAGNVYIEQTPEGTQYAGAVLLTNLNTDSQLYHGEVVSRESDRENYARKAGVGFVLVKLTAGHTYTVTAMRKYVKENYCFQVGTPDCITNNNAATINIHTYIDTHNIISQQTHFVAGGLRIAKKTESPFFGGTPIVTEYDYELTDESSNQSLARSAGCLLAIPDHVNTETFIEINTSPQETDPSTLFHPVRYGCTAYEVWIKTKITVESDPVVPLSTTQGSHLSYRQVNVKQTGNGWSTTRFLTGYEHPDTYPNEYTLVIDNPAGEDQTSTMHFQFEYSTRFKNSIPLNNMDWQRGFESGKEVYDEQGNILSRETYSYSFPVKNTVKGYSIITSFPNAQQLTIGSVEYIPYELTSGFPYMIFKTVSSYTQGQQLKTEYSYFHESNDHINLTRQIQTVSDADPIETRFTYVADKPAIANTPMDVFNYMVGKNMLYHPVKTEVYRGNVFTEGAITNYKIVSGNAVVASGESALSGPYEVRLNYVDYDASGNLTEVAKSNDISTTYIWDYNNTLPVASVTNARPSQVAYASFEADGTGGWNYNAANITSIDAKIGQRAFTISTQGLSRSTPAGNYILTYWAKGSIDLTGTTPTASSQATDDHGWVMYEKTLVLTATTNIELKSTSPNALIDEVRLFPAGAQMLTYVFDPLVGMTYQNDHNNRSTRFRYDNLGRLIAVFDNDGNVLKKYTYHFAGQ